MKYKSALTMLICCILCIVFGIIDMHLFYNKLKKQEISLKKFILIVMGIIYAITLSGFAAYSYYTGLHEKLLSVAFMPFWIVGSYVYVCAAYKKPPSVGATKGRAVFVVLLSCFLIYITFHDFYQEIYLPYLKPG